MIRKNNIKILRFKRKIIHFLKTHKLLIALVFLFFSVGIWVKIWYNKYINNPKNIVKSVFFNKNIINNPNLAELAKESEKVFIWTNTIKNKFLKYKTEKKYILDNYTFLSWITVNKLSSNSLKIDFKIKKPKLIFLNKKYIFPVYSEKNIYTFNPKYQTWLNLNIKNKVYLPKYLDNIDNLKWIFWKDKLDKFLKYTKTIKKTFPTAKLIYLAWWENIKVITKDKIYLFSLQKNIDKQLEQLKIVIINKPKFYNQASIIDVWNLDDWVYLQINNKWK